MSFVCRRYVGSETFPTLGQISRVAAQIQQTNRNRMISTMVSYARRWIILRRLRTIPFMRSFYANSNGKSSLIQMILIIYFPHGHSNRFTLLSKWGVREKYSIRWSMCDMSCMGKCKEVEWRGERKIGSERPRNEHRIFNEQDGLGFIIFSDIPKKNNRHTHTHTKQKHSKMMMMTMVSFSLNTMTFTALSHKSYTYTQRQKQQQQRIEKH